MDGFDKTFALAFCNSFLKKELNCDKENMLILNTCSFQIFLEDDFKDSTAVF